MKKIFIFCLSILTYFCLFNNKAFAQLTPSENIDDLSSREGLLQYLHLVTDNLTLTIGGQFYNFEYTGSGNPMGEPKEIEDVNTLDTIMPVTEKYEIYYLTLNFKWK